MPAFKDYFVPTGIDYGRCTPFQASEIRIGLCILTLRYIFIKPWIFRIFAERNDLLGDLIVNVHYASYYPLCQNGSTSWLKPAGSSARNRRLVCIARHGRARHRRAGLSARARVTTPHGAQTCGRKTAAQAVWRHDALSRWLSSFPSFAIASRVLLESQPLDREGGIWRSI